MIEWHEGSAAEGNRQIVWQECAVVPSHYQRLELALGASPTQIKQAYRRLARQCHPDQRPAAERELAERHMQQLNEAYAVLGNAPLRALYDHAHGIHSN
jgi:curved DNA-binding protein CbpA